MPWTAETFKTHASKLSPKQLTLAAKIANQALKRCQAKGGDDCEASAIRQGLAVGKTVKESDQDDVLDRVETNALPLLEMMGDDLTYEQMHDLRKQPQMVAKYREGKLSGDHCAVCTFYQSYDLTCRLVQSPIRPQDVCDFFVMAPEFKEEAVPASDPSAQVTISESDARLPTEHEALTMQTLIDWLPLFEGSFTILEGDKKKNSNPDIVEIIHPVLVEGRGNLRDRRWYHSKSLTSAQKLLNMQPKMYLDHSEAGQEKIPRKFSDWGGSSVEQWQAVLPDGRRALMSRTEVYHEDLQKRLRQAPTQLGVSIEGMGAGYPAKIDGENWTVVEEIRQLKHFSWVPQTGNVPLGVQLLEADLQNDDGKEIISMTLKELREQHVGIYQEAVAEIEKPLREEVTSLKARLDGTLVEFGKVTEQLRYAQAKEQVEAILSEAALPAYAVTELLREQLMTASDEQRRKLVEDRKALVSHTTGHVKNMGGFREEQEMGDLPVREAMAATQTMIRGMITRS